MRFKSLFKWLIQNFELFYKRVPSIKWTVYTFSKYYKCDEEKIYMLDNKDEINIFYDKNIFSPNIKYKVSII